MNWPAYPDYKDADVPDLGKIPTAWSPMRLRRLVTLNPAVPRRVREDPDQVVPFVPMDAIGADWSLDLSRSRPVGEVLTGYSYFENGDVLFAKVTPCFENGKGALVDGIPTGRGFGTTEVTVARPRPELDHRFLGYLLRTDRFRQTSLAAMTGAGGLKRVPDDHVRDFRVAFPPLSEQQSIADFLDWETAKIDALIDKQNQLIATLREDRTATITYAVTEGLNPDVEMSDRCKTWSDQSPRAWTVRRLSRDVIIKTGFAFPSESFTDDGMPIVRIGDIGVDGVVRLEQAKHVPIALRDSHKSYLVQDDVVIMAMTGATLGKPGRLKSGTSALLNQRTCSLSGRRESLMNEFLWYLICSRPFQEHLSLTAFGGAQPNISDADIVNVTVALPGIEEQRDIAAHLDDQCAKIDTLIIKSNQMIGSLTEYRSALIIGAVTGKIDVRGAAQTNGSA